MFTDSDVRLIRRLYLWPKLGGYFLLAIFPTLAAWVVLIMIDDIALESRGTYDAGIFALLPIVVVYLVISMVLLVRSRSLAGSDEWAAVERAALTPHVDASTPGELNAALGLASAGRVAQAVGEGRGDRNLEGVGETAQVAAGALGLFGIWHLMHTLHEAARRIADGYQSYGYRVFGYTLDISDPETSSLCVTMNEDGVVETLDFHTNFDLSLAPEENLARAERDFASLSEMVAGLDVPVAADGLLAAEPTFPEEFVEQFGAGSYYDDLIVRFDAAGGLSGTVSYETDPEEEYDEYSSSYVYLTFEAR